MLQKIEDVSLLRIMQDIKNMIEKEKFELKTNDYEIKLNKFEGVDNLEPLKKLLDIMVQNNYLITELYFQDECDFEKSFKLKYDGTINEIFNSIRIEEIVFENEEEYSGTLIYHEKNEGKLIFQLSCIKYLNRFQNKDLWD